MQFFKAIFKYSNPDIISSTPVYKNLTFINQDFKIHHQSNSFSTLIPIDLAVPIIDFEIASKDMY